MESEDRLAKLYEKLKRMRERTDLKLPPNKYLRSTYIDPMDGKEKPLVLRYYQIQMVVHLAAMRRFLVGDDTGLGKTLEIIAGLSLIWDKTPDTPAVILTTKSSAPQWVEEFNKFTEGVNAFLYEGPPEKRGKIWNEYLSADGPKVIVMNYKKAWQDFGRFKDYEGYILITDEATAYKNKDSQTHQVVCHLANHCTRLWAATATLIKNHLVEGYSIYRVVMPGLFSNHVTNFQKHYCLMEMVDVGRGRRVPKMVGYIPERIQEFRDTIDPFYLGRPKHAVAEELPVLIRKNVEVPLSKAQETLYSDIASAVANKNPMFFGENEKEITKLTALMYYQQAANHLELAGQEGPSSKLDKLIELLTEDFDGENVIVFTRFKTMVDILVPAIQQALSTGKKDKNQYVVRVTGDEDAKQRNEAKKQFQGHDDPCRVICITSAGGEAINLQSAKAIVFFDTPWSAGEYLQVLGRMIRIGSRHDRCYAVHLVSRRHESKRAWKTIDHMVIEVLDNKMELVEAVLGQRIKGESEADEISFIPVTPEVADIYASLEEEARQEAGLKALERNNTSKKVHQELAEEARRIPKSQRDPKEKGVLPGVVFGDDDEDLDALFED